MNPKKKPDYDPEAILQDMVDAAVAAYAEKPSLRYVADKLDINPVKARKLLVTAKARKCMAESCSFAGHNANEGDHGTGDGRCSMDCHAVADNHTSADGHTTIHVYESPTADEVLALWNEGRSVGEIMGITGLSKPSVNSYLPYTRPPYKGAELSSNAERIKKCRERKAAVEALAKHGGTDNLWNTIALFVGYPFRTSKGLKFKYTIHGGEMFVDRKEKSITRSSVEMAYLKALEMDGVVTGPKKLGVFGASYLYPVFVRLGVIKSSL